MTSAQKLRRIHRQIRPSSKRLPTDEQVRLSVAATIGDEAVRERFMPSGIAELFKMPASH